MTSPARTPQRTQTYQGFLTDTTRWDAFTHRPDDVFVCTLGKNGTTWMQAICALLIFQAPELDFNPGIRSPWIDAKFVPIEETIAALEAQGDRRVIKTHTPLDGIPFFPECTYITVYRDPRDTFFSMRNHLDNMKLELPSARTGSVEEAFRDWVEGEFDPNDEKMALGFATHHLLSFQSFAHLPNIHMFHYADLKRNLPGEMKKVAAALGIEVEPALLARLAEAASFQNMKRNADRFAPGADRDFWHDTSRFFNKGSHEQWRDQVSLEALRRFDERLDSLIGPELAEWLKHGSA